MAIKTSGGKDGENIRLSGRMRRFARVGNSAGGLAMRMAGQRYLGMPTDSARNAAQLSRALGGLKGPLMKVGQLLATILDGLPDAYIEEMRALQSEAPAMGWAFVKRRMQSELGADWRQRFEAFEQDAAAAASLGQVPCPWSGWPRVGLQIAISRYGVDGKGGLAPAEADTRHLQAP